MRNRMMHFAVDKDLNVYLASIKGDPKVLQMTRQPSVALLVYRNDGDINDSREVEITGHAIIVLSGVFYTGRPFNFASRGIGELLVGLNFGVLMTLGAY